MLLKNMILTVCLFALISVPAVSMQISPDVTNNEKPRNTLTIHEGNFSCFQNLQCLKRENPFKNSNLVQINLNSMTDRYVVEGTSKNESIFAVYSGSGDLIKATVIQRNIILPKTILRRLASADFEDWFVIGNELVIENFNKNSMQYQVILQDENDVRVEYFDRDGNIQNRFL